MDFEAIQYATTTITNFIKDKVRNNNSTGVIIGLSGGIDSAVVCYLATNSIGPDKIFCIVMPDGAITPQSDIDDALEICSNLKIKYKIIYIDTIKKAFNQILDENTDKVLYGNLISRIRMCILYYYAGLENKLVLGTSNKTELLTGYFTKYGDGASDLLPIGDLYKMQVRTIATFLKISNKIISKKSSARLWKDQNTEKDLGLPFEVIDTILISDQNNVSKEKSHHIKVIEEIKNKFSYVTDQEITKILSLKEKNKHKLFTPPICKLDIKDKSVD